MNDVRDTLAQLGLKEYAEAFISEGFDSLETLSDITESDFNHLNVKLGHRRKIQRAVADWNVQTGRRSLHLPEFNDVSQVSSHHDRQTPSDDCGKVESNEALQQRVRSPSHVQWHDTPVSNGGHVSSRDECQSKDESSEVTRTKRKYRRHPKPDEHAPQRPQSAYVIFSNHLREKLKDRDLSFTEMAKIVGEQWQVLDATTRGICESQAAAAKQRYYTELAEYKKTDKYAEYQDYLQGFKAKHGDQNTETLTYNHATFQADDKRIKLRTEASNSTQSSLEMHENQQPRYPVAHSDYAVSTSSDTTPGRFSQPTSPGSIHMGRKQSPFDERGTMRAHLASQSLNGPRRQSSAGSSGDRGSSVADQDTVQFNNTSSAFLSKFPPASSLHRHSTGPVISAVRGMPCGVLPAEDRSSSPKSPLGGILEAPRFDRTLPALGTSLPHRLPTRNHRDVVEHRVGPKRLVHSPSSSISSAEDPRQSASLAALLRAGETASREADRSTPHGSRYNL